MMAAGETISATVTQHRCNRGGWLSARAWAEWLACRRTEAELHHGIGALFVRLMVERASAMALAIVPIAFAAWLVMTGLREAGEWNAHQRERRWDQALLTTEEHVRKQPPLLFRRLPQLPQLSQLAHLSFAGAGAARQPQPQDVD